MDKEVLIYTKAIKKFLREGKVDYINRLFEKLKKEGRSYLFKKIILALKKDLQEEANIEFGDLHLAIFEDFEIIKNYLEKILGKQVVFENIEENPNLILGGVFIGKKVMIDFSMKKIFEKIFI
jgi:F0F1-type ATP synthase delta subunit